VLINENDDDDDDDDVAAKVTKFQHSMPIVATHRKCLSASATDDRRSPYIVCHAKRPPVSMALKTLWT